MQQLSILRIEIIRCAIVSNCIQRQAPKAYASERCRCNSIEIK